MVVLVSADGDAGQGVTEYSIGPGAPFGPLPTPGGMNYGTNWDDTDSYGTVAERERERIRKINRNASIHGNHGVVTSQYTDRTSRSSSTSRMGGRTTAENPNGGDNLARSGTVSTRGGRSASATGQPLKQTRSTTHLPNSAHGPSSREPMGHKGHMHISNFANGRGRVKAGGQIMTCTPSI
ncbi:hypothetical protein ACMFMG_002233 [Clarireedia jacksonii]